MKKLIIVCQALAIAAVISTLALGAQIINFDERLVGANHPTLADTLNRGFLIQHDAEGVHTIVPWSTLTGTPTTLGGYGITDAGAQDNVAITGGTIDNTVIGGTTPAAGIFTSLATDNVTSDEMNYLAEVTGDIQGQVDSKQAESSRLTNLSSGTIQDNTTIYDDIVLRFGTDNDFTLRYKSADATLIIALDNGDSMLTLSKVGTLTVTGTVIAPEFQSGCSYEDNTCFYNASDVGAPGGTPLAGDSYYDNTSKINQTYDGANWRYGQYDALEFVIGNGTDAITTGEKGHIEVPYPCDIQSIRLFADASGSIVVDLWKDTYANFPPTVADNVTGTGTKPTLSSTQKAELTDFTNYTTTTLAAGDVLAYNVDSANTVKRVTISIRVRK